MLISGFNRSLTVLVHGLHSGARSAMDQAVLLEEQKCMIRRYVEVWRHFRRLPDRQSGFVDLEDDMNKGAGMLLCGLLVETSATRVITADVKDPKFYTAIFENDDSAAPDLTTEELHRARRYIIQGEGTAPPRGREVSGHYLSNVLLPTDGPAFLSGGPSDQRGRYPASTRVPRRLRSR
jgi:hypothetical protein